MEEWLTIHKLSQQVPFSYEWLLANARKREHPIPTISCGRVKKVRLSSFVKWLEEEEVS